MLNHQSGSVDLPFSLMLNLGQLLHLNLYDDVRRVCKTPGDPCGCTKDWFAVAFSLDLTFVCFLFLTVLFTNEFHFFLSFTNWFRSFNGSPVTLLMSSIHRIWGFPFFLAVAVIPSIISFSKDSYAITYLKYRIFSIFVVASDEMFDLTLYKISLFDFPFCPRLSEFSAIPIVRKHQVFFFSILSLLFPTIASIYAYVLIQMENNNWTAVLVQRYSCLQHDTMNSYSDI